MNKELKLYGSFRFANVFEDAMNMVAAGIINLDGIDTDTFSFDDIPKAMQYALDKNGVIMDDEHQRFLDELQQYLLNENILVHYDADPKSNPESYDQLVEYIDYYSQTTSAPVCASLMQGYFKYLKKDSKGANLLWNTEILKLKKFVNLDEKTAYGERYKDDLGNEIILSTVDLKVQFKKAARLGDVLTKKLWVKNLGGASILCGFQFEDENGKTCLEGEVTLVNVAFTEGRDNIKAEVFSEEMKQKIKESNKKSASEFE